MQLHFLQLAFSPDFEVYVDMFYIFLFIVVIPKFYSCDASTMQSWRGLGSPVKIQCLLSLMVSSLLVWVLFVCLFILSKVSPRQ